MSSNKTKSTKKKQRQGRPGNPDSAGAIATKVWRERKQVKETRAKHAAAQKASRERKTAELASYLHTLNVKVYDGIDSNGEKKRSLSERRIVKYANLAIGWTKTLIDEGGYSNLDEMNYKQLRSAAMQLEERKKNK